MNITEEKTCQGCEVLVQAPCLFKRLYTNFMSYTVKFSRYPTSIVYTEASTLLYGVSKDNK